MGEVHKSLKTISSGHEEMIEVSEKDSLWLLLTKKSPQREDFFERKVKKIERQFF